MQDSTEHDFRFQDIVVRYRTIVVDGYASSKIVSQRPAESSDPPWNPGPPGTWVDEGKKMVWTPDP